MTTPGDPSVPPALLGFPEDRLALEDLRADGRTEDPAQAEEWLRARETVR